MSAKTETERQCPELAERMYYNAALIKAKNDYRGLKKLKDRLETWGRVFAELSRTSGASDPENEWKKLENVGVRLILSGEPGFPPLLREIPWPPFGLYVLGELPEPERPTVGIVGTRKATDDGIELARTFAFELSEAGVAIVSGLAFGIDSAGHRGCLEANGATIAVLGNGLDAVYPASNEKLGKRILASGGALVSEYPLGAPSLPHHFIERNRLISGLSLGIVVIEAPEASGALATARFALDQNREIFVVPGPARHKNFYGSHQLLRSGARLTTRAAEILEDLNLERAAEEQAGRRDFETSEEKIIFELLEKSAEPLEVDRIVEIAHLESRIVNQSLTFLLMKNMIREQSGGYTIK